MPDGFSFRVSFAETDETFNYHSRTGDVAGFRDAYEAVRDAAAGRDEAEIGELLAGELRSRNIGLLPDNARSTSRSVSGGYQTSADGP